MPAIQLLSLSDTTRFVFFVLSMTPHAPFFEVMKTAEQETCPAWAMIKVE
jgi:hypothetical protein